MRRERKKKVRRKEEGRKPRLVCEGGVCRLIYD